MSGHKGLSHIQKMKIEDYAFLSDTQTGALVGRDGSVDWLCFPRFDSGACFAALLGDRNNGRWSFLPTEEITATRRRYRDGSRRGQEGLFRGPRIDKGVVRRRRPRRGP